MPTSTTFEPKHAQQLLALLRESAPSLLSNVDDEQALGKTMQLEDLATRLMSYGGMRSANLLVVRSRRVTNLLRAYILASRLRNKSTLRKVMVECFALAEVDEEQQNQWLQDSLKGTSAASLSRSQVFVDAALMRMAGLRYAGNCGPIYIWADSSPQHGTDWFLSLVATIHEADLDECMRCAHVLANRVVIFESDGPQDELMRAAMERKAAGLTLSEKFVVHSQVPMGLGSGESSVEQKVKCLALKFLGEVQSLPMTNAIFKRIRCFCVDMGTELSMNDVEGLKLRDVSSMGARSCDSRA